MPWRYWEIKASSRSEALKKMRRKLANDNQTLGTKTTCHLLTKFDRKVKGEYAVNTYAKVRRK